MPRIPLAIPTLLGCSLLIAQQAPTRPPAQETCPWSFGLQAGLGMAVGSDLRATTEGKPGFQIGARGTYRWDERQSLRLTADHLAFPEGRQTRTLPGLGQTLQTTVTGQSLGTLYVCRLDRFEVGAGLAWTRWTVDSRNTLDDTRGNSLTHTGSSSWSKVGFTASLGLPLGKGWTVEGRFLASQYGHEDAPVRMTSLNAVWTF